MAGVRWPPSRHNAVDITPEPIALAERLPFGNVSERLDRATSGREPDGLERIVSECQHTHSVISSPPTRTKGKRQQRLLVSPLQRSPPCGTPTESDR